MDTNYIISQLFVVFAMLSLGATYLCKDKKKIVALGILYAILYGGQYLLLGAMTGFAMNIISIIRNIWFYINAKNNKKNNLIVLIVLIVLAIIFGAISYSNIFSIIPVIASILYTYSIWQDNVKTYRWLALPISALWITYNICSKSIFGIIAELILLIVEIIGIIKIQKLKK